MGKNKLCNILGDWNICNFFSQLNSKIVTVPVHKIFAIEQMQMVQKRMSSVKDHDSKRVFKLGISISACIERAP